tara:strand:+ start:782 stop:1453 length:672 start_codon:yes stop_codon:yes gene_type:complete
VYDAIEDAEDKDHLKELLTTISPTLKCLSETYGYMNEEYADQLGEKVQTAIQTALDESSEIDDDSVEISCSWVCDIIYRAGETAVTSYLENYVREITREYKEMIKSGFALHVIGNYEDIAVAHRIPVKEKLHKEFTFVVNESFDQVETGEAFSHEKDGYLLPLEFREKINIIIYKFFGNQDKTVWENKESAKKASEDLYWIISDFIDVYFLPKKPTKSATMKN